jgi:hypothetical protein
MTTRRKLNRIEYWLRVGPLGNDDARKTYPSDTYVRRCICGLTYTRNNWVLRWRTIVGIGGLAVFAIVCMLADAWPLLELLAVAWAVMTLVFLMLGHKLPCALRRPPIAMAMVISSKGQG